MASEVDPYVHGGNSSSNLKVRPPNPNSNLVTNSKKCINKDRGEFLDKSTLQESYDTGRENDKTFVVDWGQSITLQNLELAYGNWIASSKVTNIEDENCEMYVVDNVPN